MKSRWRLSLPDHLNSKLGDDKRVCTSRWAIDSDPNDIFQLDKKVGDGYNIVL